MVKDNDDFIVDEQQAIDALNASLTESGQAPLPVKKESDESEEEEEEEEENDSDDEEEEDEGKESDDGKHRKGGIPTKTFNDVRSQLREKSNRVQELEDEIASLKKPAAQIDPEVITAAAKKMLGDDATEEQIKGTEAQLQIIFDLAAQANKASESTIKELKEELEERKQQESFVGEWSGFVGDIKQAYPKANSDQLAEAQKIMDDLSHSEKFKDKDLDYILFKTKDIFDEIFKDRKSKTFESRDTYNHQDDEEDDDISDINPSKAPIDKVLKLHSKLEQEAREQDDASGWGIKNAAQL